MPDHPGRTLSLGSFANVRAAFLIMDALVEDLPNQATKPMGNHGDCLLMAHARYIAAVEDLKDASVPLGGGQSSLIEKAAHVPVAFR